MRCEMSDVSKNFIVLQCRYNDRITPYTQHFHMSYEMIFIKKGTINLVINKKSYDIPENKLVFISKLEEHSIRILSPVYERYYVIISSDKLDRYIMDQKLLSVFKNRPENFIHHMDAPENTEEIMKRIIHEYQNRDSFSEDIIYYQIKDLLVQLYRANKDQFPIPEKHIKAEVYAVQQYIDQNFREDLKVSDLANKFYINVYYLTHSFKELTGYSPKQYILLNKLSYAKSLLADRELSIEQIAIKAGFYDSSSFIRSFKKEYGKTPNSYRNQ